MRVWLVEISDFVPKLDPGQRLYRCGMLAGALAAAGHEVRWWTSTFNHQLRRQRFEESTTVELQPNYHLRLLYGPGYSRSKSPGRIMHNRAVAKAFAREVVNTPAAERPDIIYTSLPTPEVSEQAVLYGNAQNIPVVVDIRDLWPETYLTVLPRFLRRMFRILIRRELSRATGILSGAKAITASSPAYLKWGAAIAKRDIRHTDRWFPLGASDPHDEDSKPELVDSVKLPGGVVLKKQEFIVVFAGMLTRLFEYRTVLEVARRVSKSGHDIHFVFIGDGDQRQYLQKKAAKLSNVYFTGWQEKEFIRKMLAISSVGLAPYSSILHQPTLPNKPFEYMAAGLPLLSSLGGDLREIITKESIGINYTENDHRDLYAKLLWLYSNPEERKEMGRRAKKLFDKKYNADVVYNDFVNHLCQIAKGAKSR